MQQEVAFVIIVVAPISLIVVPLFVAWRKDRRARSAPDEVRDAEATEPTRRRAV